MTLNQKKKLLSEYPSMKKMCEVYQDMINDKRNTLKGMKLDGMPRGTSKDQLDIYNQIVTDIAELQEKILSCNSKIRSIDMAITNLLNHEEQYYLTKYYLENKSLRDIEHHNELFHSKSTINRLITSGINNLKL